MEIIQGGEVLFVLEEEEKVLGLPVMLRTLIRRFAPLPVGLVRVEVASHVRQTFSLVSMGGQANVSSGLRARTPISVIGYFDYCK